MESRYDINNLKIVVQSLVDVFKVIPKDTDLETMIDMMKDDMTFDDPGLFLRQSIHDETEEIIQEGAILWLIHQFMYVVSCENYVRSQQKTVEIQKSLLSACYIKQHWLFRKLIEKYVEFTIQLANVDFSLKEPFVVDIFQFDKFKETSLIPEDYPQRIISIKNLPTLHFFAMTNMKILTHAIALLVNSDEMLMKRCTIAVLQSFDVMDFRIKTLTLNFLLEETAHCNPDYRRAIIQSLLQSFETINSHIDQWNVVDQVDEFDAIIIQFLCDEKVLLSFCEVTGDCTKIFDFCLSIIERQREIRGNNYGHLILSAYRCLRVILMRHITPVMIMKINNFVVKNRNITKENLRLLEYCVLEECKANDSVYTWHVGCELAEETLNQCDRCVVIEEISEKITLFKHLLEVSLRIQSNFIAWHQRQHLHHINIFTCGTCSQNIEDKYETIIVPNQVTKISIKYPTLLSNLKTLSHLFVTIVKNKKGLSRVDVSTISILLLSLWNSMDSISNFEDLLSLSTCIFNFYETNKRVNAELSIKTISREDKIRIMRRLFNIKITFSTNILNSIFEMMVTEKLFPDICISSIIQRICNPQDVLANLFGDSIRDSSFDLILSEQVKSLICLTSHNCNGLLNIDNDYHYSVFCNSCNGDFVIDDHLKEIILPITFTEHDIMSDQYMERILKLFQSNKSQVRINMVESLPAICSRHSNVLCAKENLYWTNIFNDEELAFKFELLETVPLIVDAIQDSNLDKTIKESTIQLCMEKLLKATTKSLEDSDDESKLSADEAVIRKKYKQSAVVALIGKFTSSKTTSERTLLMCFRKMIFYLVHPKSLVAANASLCAVTMCRQKGIKPKRLYNWYKEQILSLVIRLAVSMYLEYGLLLDKTLANFNEMLGYTNLKRELMKNDFSIITALVLPYALKYPTCQELLQSVCALTNLHLDLLFARSFIQIYVYLHLRQPPEVAENCLKFITNKTGKSVSFFLKSDSKRSLSEVLLSYHKKPELSAQTIRILMSNEDTVNKDISIDRITQYLATRFLGVLNSFGTILMTTNFEKSFQKDALRSLGEIIRFVGTQDITQFRFKILELLHSVGTLDVEDLTNICVSVWRIFIHTVDISKLGPQLSTILVLLEPLLNSHADEVNGILKFLIISNGSLINRFISDLFFLEQTQVCDEIKNFVADHSQKLLVDDTFLKKLKLYSKQINHENVANVGVRIYGLRYLSELFFQREELNELILGQQQINPVIENLLENLMEGSKHVDEKLQIESAICLGRLGAIEPSLLPRNYAPESYFAFRKCCEITLKVLQQQMPILMSVLKPFAYDPLVDWNKKSATTTERTDKQAMNNVQRIEERLKGLIKSHIVGKNVSNSNIPLSVEGVVKHCINEATDVDKLACMFFGWSAFL